MSTSERPCRSTRLETIVFTPRDSRLSQRLRRVLEYRSARALYRFLILFGLGVFLLSTDIWVVGAALRTSLNRFVVQVTTWIAPPPRDSAVTVVLWTESSLAHLRDQGVVNQVWPIGYAAHAELLYSLSEYDPLPSALFIDFAFLTHRDDSGFDDLLTGLRLFAELGVPVFISCIPGAGPPAFRELHNLQAILEASVDPVVRPMVFVPATIADETVVQHYPMHAGERTPAEVREAAGEIPRSPDDCVPEGRAALTAAPAMYNALFADPQNRGRQKVTVGSPRLSLIYDTRVHDATRVYFGSAETRIRCGEHEKIDRLWENLIALVKLPWGLIADSDALRVPRAGPPILPASAVLLELPGEPNPAAKSICQRPMRDFISGRPILIGSNLAAADDFRDTLTDRLQPSILVHATALQNLAQYGSGYPREDLVLERDDGPLIIPLRCMEILYALILSLLHAEFLTRRERGAGCLQLQHDAESEPGGATSFFVQRSLPVLAAFIFAMTAMHIHATEILFLAISLALLRRPLGIRAVNAGLLWLMFRKESTIQNRDVEPFDPAG